MRLSEAIRLGSLTRRPQGGQYFSENNGACALGMAGVAAGFVGLEGCDGSFLQELERTWPWIDNSQRNPPCGCPPAAFVDDPSNGFVIAHLFDSHVDFLRDWTIERLVDWVRSVEPAEESPKPNLQTLLEEIYDREVEHA